MSIEYTIDIQLMELGFPDPLQPQDSSVPTAASAGQAKRSGIRTRQRARDEQAAQIGQAVDDSSAGHAEEPQPINKEGEVGGKEVPNGEAAQNVSTEAQQGVDDDSDDSDVSDMYEEEEIDIEEYEEEQELTNESSPSDGYSCSVCNLHLPSKFKLQDHMNLHTGARPYCCAECGKRFCQIYNYRVHLRSHAGAQRTEMSLRFRCRVCRSAFETQKELDRHLSRTHFEKEFYECDLCKFVFTSLRDCKAHVQLHKSMQDFSCEKCGRRFSSQKSRERHQKKKKCRSNFRCTDCQRMFTGKNALLKHSFSHLGLLPYTCVRCRTHFRLAKFYRQHKCEPERISCVACLRQFVSERDFEQHKKDTGCWGNREHKGDEIRCLECGERFDSAEELRKHAGAHQRVLKCAECGKGFRSALLLMSHMGGHAGQSPCLCQSCGLGFPHQQNYDSHLKTCGKTPLPASASKKHHTSKSSSSSETKKLNAITDASSSANKVSTPAAVSPEAPLPVIESVTSGHEAERMATQMAEQVSEQASTGSQQSDGLWKLTLDKEPPPGVNLVLFMPFASGLSSNPEVQPDAPLDPAGAIIEDPQGEIPLDLSKRTSSNSPVSDVATPHTVKIEPQEFENSKESVVTGGRDHKGGSCNGLIVQTDPVETEVKALKTEPVHWSLLDTSSKLIMDIKEEPQADDTMDYGTGSAKS